MMIQIENEKYFRGLECFCQRSLAWAVRFTTGIEMRLIAFVVSAALALIPTETFAVSVYTVPPGVSTSLTNPNINIVTPQMFGAVCDDTTDDHVALQQAEDAAYANKASVAFIGPKLCKSTVALTPHPGVDHFCYSGMNLANGAATNECGILRTGSGWAYDMPTLPYGGRGAGVTSPTWHDMAIDSADGGIRIGNMSLGQNQAVASYLKIERVTFSSQSDAVQATVCFYCKIDQSWFISPVRFYMSDYVNISNSSFQSQFTGSTDPEVILLGDSTYGNDDVVYHNFFECPSHGTTSCLKSNVNSVVIRDNGFECGDIHLNAVIDIAAPTTLGAFSNIIEDNSISCAASAATHWLTVENTQYLYLLKATGNWVGGGAVYGSASFNGGGTMPVYVPTTTFLSQIYHSGNTNEAGFPYSSYSNFPEAADPAPGVLMTWAPGGTAYNVTPTGYGLSVAALFGAYQQPAASGGNPLDFTQVPNNFTGTLDLCLKARSSNSAQVETLVAMDGGTPIATANFTMSGGTNPSWYCYKGHSYSTGATLRLLNSDTTHGSEVDIYQVTINSAPIPIP